jgi:uncharacterized protein YdcH (DUF465 family)
MELINQINKESNELYNNIMEKINKIDNYIINTLENNIKEDNIEEVKENKQRKPRTKKDLICNKCGINIEKTLYNYYICKDCFNAINNLYY